MEAYGFPIKNFTESDCVDNLDDILKMHKKKMRKKIHNKSLDLLF